MLEVLWLNEFGCELEWCVFFCGVICSEEIGFEKMLLVDLFWVVCVELLRGSIVGLSFDGFDVVGVLELFVRR